MLKLSTRIKSAAVWTICLSVWLASVVALFGVSTACAAQQTFAQIANEVQPKMVKIFGAGGLRGLEAYQSGFLISADGDVLTSWTYVLDTEDVTVVLHDGRKFSAMLVGADPRLEIAVLRIEATELPYFDLQQAVTLSLADRVLAFSNLYGVATGNEPTSVQHGFVTAVAPLVAQRGSNRVPFDGDVYIVDAMTNNAGAAGGALTNSQGQLAGILGREVRDARNNVWLNYAVPIATLLDSIQKIKSGELIPRLASDELIPVPSPWTLPSLGISLVPDVLAKTPAFVDSVIPDSAAANAGMQSDDLILYVNERLVRSVKDVQRELTLISREVPISFTVQRDGELKVYSFDPM
jgi:serine protease Do